MGVGVLIRRRLRRWSMSHKMIVTSRALTATITSGRALIPCPRLNNIEDANDTVDSLGRRLPARARYRRARFPDGYGVHCSVHIELHGALPPARPITANRSLVTWWASSQSH